MIPKPILAQTGMSLTKGLTQNIFNELNENV